MFCDIALARILETVVTFHFSGGKVYSMNKGCHTCMIKHTMHVQPLHCSTYLTWLNVYIYVPSSHFHFLKRLEKANLGLQNLNALTLLLKYLQLFLKSD